MDAGTSLVSLSKNAKNLAHAHYYRLVWGFQETDQGWVQNCNHDANKQGVNQNNVALVGFYFWLQVQFY